MSESINSELSYPSPSDAKEAFQPDPANSGFGKQSKLVPGLPASSPFSIMLNDQLEAALRSPSLPKELRVALEALREGRGNLGALLETRYVAPEEDEPELQGKGQFRD